MILVLTRCQLKITQGRISSINRKECETLADDPLVHKLVLPSGHCEMISLNFENLVYNIISVPFSILSKLSHS